jgi:UDP-N-acetylglucosamine 2-epimerase
MKAAIILGTGPEIIKMGCTMEFSGKSNSNFNSKSI